MTPEGVVALACEAEALALWDRALETYRRLGCFRVETTSDDPFVTEWLEVDLETRRFRFERRYEPANGDPDGVCGFGDGRTVTAWNPYQPATYRQDTQSPELCDAVQHQICIVLDPEFRRNAYTFSARRTAEGSALVLEGSFVMQFTGDPPIMTATWSEGEGGVRRSGWAYRTLPIPEVRMVPPPQGAVLRNPRWTELDTAARADSAHMPHLPDPMITVSGEAVRAVDLRGRPTVFEFWATWCGSCRERIHHLQQVQEAFGDRVHVLGVSRDDNAAVAEAFARARGFRFPVVSDPGRYGSGLFADWQVDGVPTLFVLDRALRPILRGVGVAWTEIREAVERVLESDGHTLG